jgi:hypothetical protein
MVYPLLFAAAALMDIGAQDRPPPPAPPPPPAAFEDWSLLQPVAKSDRVSVVCRGAGRITAEFALNRPIVSVVSVKGVSHRLSPSERATINAAVRPLGYVDRVDIACNGPDQAVITVRGGMVEVNGKMMQQFVSIVWERSRMTGMGGRKFPEIELTDYRH